MGNDEAGRYIDAAAAFDYDSAMSTVAEIKAAIDRLSPREREELDALVWPGWDLPLRPDEETPPGIHEKLSAAVNGRFTPVNRANMEKIWAETQ